MRRTVPPSAEIEEQIDRLLAVGVGENPRESLSELAKLGARLIIQRAVEDEFDAWLGRAQLRAAERRRRDCATAFGRAGCRPREATFVEIPQVRAAAEPFVSKLFPRGTKLLRTEPLKAMVIGAFVRGLRCATSSRCASRPGSGSSRSRPHPGSAPNCASALRRSAPRPLRHPLAALFLDAVFLGPPRRPQGGRARRMGVHRGGRARLWR